jgi:hypothetical protein
MARVRISGEPYFDAGDWHYEGKGMTRAQVRAILGPADDVITPADPKRAFSRGTLGDGEEEWCYGTDRHLGFPTLGRVAFEHGETLASYGSQGSPPPARLFREAELRSLFRLLSSTPDPMSGGVPDPLAVIRIVNALQPLGKEKAIAAIGEYARITSYAMTPREVGAKRWEWMDNEGLYLVVAILFGRPTWPDAYRPWFDWALQDDIPLVVQTYGGTGPQGFFENEFDQYRIWGRLRAKPLVPTDRPLSTLDRLDAVLRPGGVPNRRLVMSELLRLIEPVYATKPDRWGDRLPKRGDVEEWWKEIGAAVEGLRLRWDPNRNSYVAGAAPRSAR